MRNKKGFTLVELIAVIAILGMIMIIAVPKVYNSIVSNKKRTFIINAKNIVRQLEYDNLEFNTFTKIPLGDLGLKKISSKNIDLKNSVAYIVDDEIVLDLVGKSDYKDFYLCNLAYTNEDYIVQSTPCDKEHNFVYIDFVVDLDGGSTSQNFNTKYLSGNYLVLEIPKKPNDTFLGWELVSGNSILDQNRIKFGTENTRIKAIWGNNPELVINLNGGTSSQKFDSKYSGGSLIILQEPTREGYKFKGWNLVVGNAILSGNVLTTGTTNTVIEAVWELSEFNISYELNGGTIEENAPTKGKGGSSVIVSNPTKLGYKFKGWDIIGTGSSISGTILTMGTANVILVANWEVNNYTISYNLNGGSVSGNPGSYTIETDSFTLNNPIKTGYVFTGWTDSDGNDLGDFVTISKGTAGDKMYTANYTIGTYTINYNLDGGTSGESAPTSGTYGSTVVVSNPTKAGYTFKGWEISGTGSILSGTNLTIGSENIILTATWYKFPVLAANYPQDKEVAIHASVTSEVVISEAGSPSSYTYQWYDSNGLINGATSSSYTFTPTKLGTTNLYCEVTNSAGTVTTRTATITTTGLYLYKNGDNCSSTTGGWTSTGMRWDADFGGNVYRTVWKVDLSKYNTLEFNGKLNSNDNSMYAQLAIWSSIGSYVTSNRVKYISANNTSGTRTIDISTLSGSYYIGIYTLSCVYGTGSYSMNYIMLK